MSMEIEALAWDRHKNVAGSTCSSNWTSNLPLMIIGSPKAIQMHA
jgi:hypothetical protein